MIVSIFVNPLQFGPDEDYARYPRQLEADLEICRDGRRRRGVHPERAETSTRPGAGHRQRRRVRLDPGGCFSSGPLRRRADRGRKFFNIVRPDVAIFGKKDAQQLACIRRMVTDLNSPDVVGAPIVREPDGLAMSSRNRYLTQAERTSALSLHAALRAAELETTPPSPRGGRAGAGRAGHHRRDRARLRDRRERRDDDRRSRPTSRSRRWRGRRRGRDHAADRQRRAHARGPDREPGAGPARRPDPD